MYKTLSVHANGMGLNFTIFHYRTTKTHPLKLDENTINHFRLSYVHKVPTIFVGRRMAEYSEDDFGHKLL